MGVRGQGLFLKVLFFAEELFTPGRVDQAENKGKSFKYRAKPSPLRERGAKPFILYRNY